MPSTVIRFNRYVPERRQLFLTFVTGREYVYFDVPPDVYEAFQAAPSKGSFFNLEIRPNYEFREVAAPRKKRSAA